MTVADVARFALIIVVGFLAFITFLVAATIVGLMWFESSRCDCANYPVGLYVLGLLGILLLVSIATEVVDIQPVFENWAENQREALIVAIIFLVVVLLLIF